MKHLENLFKIKALFAFALASVLVGSLVQQYLARGKLHEPNCDFYVYYFAAQIVRDNPHANIYDGIANTNPETLNATAGSEISKYAERAGFGDVMYYLYPPLLADFLTPFTRIPSHLAATLWRAFNMALVLASAFLLARLLRIPILSFEFVALFVAGYSFFPIHEALMTGQIVIVMLALWMAGISAYHDGRVVVSAALFALATALKVTPILLLPLFFIWKDRRWIVSYLSASLGLLAAMTAINGLQTIRIYSSVMAAMSGGIPSAINKTLGSLVYWVYYGRILAEDSARGIVVSPPSYLMFAAKAVCGIFYLFCLYLVWRCRRIERVSRAAVIAVFSLVTLCVAPVSWRHGYSIAFIALAIYWVKALRNPRTRPLRAVLLALTTFTIGCIFVEYLVAAPLPQLCKIPLAALWVVFSVLFSVDALYHISEDSQDGTENGCSAASFGVFPRLHP